MIATVAIVYTQGFTRWWLARGRSHINREYLLVLEILLQGDAAGHDGCELDVVHSAGTGVFGQIFFDDLATNPANPSDKASDGCGIEKRLHELVVRHGGVYLVFKFRFHRRCRCLQLHWHIAVADTSFHKRPRPRP